MRTGLSTLLLPANCTCFICVRTRISFLVETRAAPVCKYRDLSEYSSLVLSLVVVHMVLFPLFLYAVSDLSNVCLGTTTPYIIAILIVVLL